MVEDCAVGSDSDEVEGGADDRVGGGGAEY